MRVQKRDSGLEAFNPQKIQRAVLASWYEAKRQAPSEEVLETIARKVKELFKSDIVKVGQIHKTVEKVLEETDAEVAKHYREFRLKRDEIRKQRLKPDNMAIADYIHVAKYAKYRKEWNRREIYPETVDRVKEMHVKKFEHLGEDFVRQIEEAFEFVHRKEVLPSMRSMQFAGKAIEDHNAKMYNCSSTLVDRPRAFAEIMYLLLCGCGVGFSVQWQHVDKLPMIAKMGRQVVHHIIEDNIIGWSEAVDALINAAIAGVWVEFSYSKIRDEGKELKTSGGKAPGHLGLKESLENCRKILLGAQERKLRPLECHDIVCYEAEAVLSGGIRRSSLLSMFSPEDTEMLYSKAKGNFEPWPGGKNYHRAMANNSMALIRSEINERAFKRGLRIAQENYGCPGFVFIDTDEHTINPCLHPDSRLLTEKGYQKIEDLFKEGQPVKVYTDNRVCKNEISKERKGSSLKQASHVFLTQKTAEVYEVSLKFGYSVKATMNHEFYTTEGKKKLADLKNGDVLLLSSGASQGLGGSSRDFDNGFVLGHLTGNGTFTDGKNGENAFLDMWEYDFDDLDWLLEKLNVIVREIPISPEARRTFGDVKWADATESLTSGIKKKRVGSVRFYNWIKSFCNVASPREIKQRVPERIWSGNTELVKGYLQGLFYTDGTVYCTGTGTKSTLSLRLSQSNEPFLKDVQKILTRFGVCSSVLPRKEGGVKKLPGGEYYCKPTFELIINRPNSIMFRERIGLSGRKGKLLDSLLVQRGVDCRKPERFTAPVVDIKFHSVSDVYCLTEPETNSIIVDGVVIGNCAEIVKKPVYYDPILEQKITGIGWCCLVEVNVATVKSNQDFLDRCKAASFINTLQASYTDFPFLGHQTQEIAKRDALLGTGLVGILDSPQFGLNPPLLEKGARLVLDENERVAKIIGINPTKRATTVKPSGTSSLELGAVGSGIHPHHARRFFRRVTANKNEPAAQYFASINPHMVEEVPGSNDFKLVFPIQVPDTAITVKTLPAREFCEIVLLVYKHWVVPGNRFPGEEPNHNVSSTITMRESEKENVINFIWKNRDSITAMSFADYFLDKAFKYAPREEVLDADEERWNNLISNYKPVDWTKFHEMKDNTSQRENLACGAGGCEI